jgi:chromosome segregation ATPase
MRRLALFVLLAVAAAAPARAQLFDDNEARRRVELLRQQLEAYKKSVDERMTKAESTAQAAADRSALLDLASQIDTLRGEIAKMRGQLEVIANQADTAEARQKQLYLDIDTRLRRLEQAREQAAAAPEKPAAQAGEGEPSPGEAKAYQAALDQFKLGN